MADKRKKKKPGFIERIRERIRSGEVSAGAQAASRRIALTEELGKDVDEQQKRKQRR
jgi:hypothetical protein